MEGFVLPCKIIINKYCSYNAPPTAKDILIKKKKPQGKMYNLLSCKELVFFSLIIFSPVENFVSGHSLGQIIVQLAPCLGKLVYQKQAWYIR